MLTVKARMIRQVRRFAFTLIEVLVVLSIVAVLAAIILPAIASSRARATSTACASNLRQLHAAFALYAQDNNDYLPPYNNYLDKEKIINGIVVPTPDQSAELVQCITPYAHSRKIWFCTADRNAGKNYRDLWINHQFTDYVYHADNYNHRDSVVRIDISGPVLGPDYLALLSDNPWGCKQNPTQSDFFDYSHGGRYNAVFFDGHLRNYTYESPTCVTP